jgi:AcrR family transcriptional regulator
VTRPRGRPRRAGADEEILDVARQLLRENGYRDLNIDTVAERAGVAKTTLYRRWPSKGALVAAAMEPLASAAGGDVLSLLRETCTLLNLLLGFDKGGVDDTEVLRAVLEPQRRRLQALIVVDSELLADILLGALVTRFLVTREPLDDAFARAVLLRIT